MLFEVIQSTVLSMIVKKGIKKAHKNLKKYPKYKFVYEGLKKRIKKYI